jgi:hypothetical protein
VLIATTPAVGPGASGRARAERGLRADHARRVEIYNSLVRSVAASNDRVDVLEYGALIDGLDAETSAAWLPDGIHPTDAASLTVWDQLIGPAVVAAVTPEPTELLTAPPPEGPGT